MKKTGRKLFALLLALVLAVSILSTSAFAEGYFGTGSYTKETVDNCFENSIIPATKTKMSAFATFAYADADHLKYLSKDDSQSSGIITIIDPEKDAQEACKEIVGTMMNKLLEEVGTSAAVKEVRPNSDVEGTLPGTCIGGSPETCLSEDGGLKFPGPGPGGASSFDDITIFEFCQNLGLLKGSHDGTLRDLDGHAFAFDIVKSEFASSSPEITYVFTFKLPKLELIPDEKEKLDVDEGLKTVSGNDLISSEGGNKAKNVRDVIALFENKVDNVDGASISIYNQDGQKMDESDTVGTGCKVKLETGDGIELNHLTVIITGDVSGDGKIISQDASKVLDYQVDGSGLDGVYLKAGELVSGEANDKVGAREAARILDIEVGI